MSLAQQTLLGGPTGVHGADDRHRRPHSVDDGIYVRPAATQRTGDPGIDLELLPNEKLQALLTNEEVLQEYLTSWLASSAAAKALEDTRQQNVTLAQQNVSMQESIDEARTHVVIVRSGDYAAAKDVFDDLLRRQEAVLAKVGPAVMLQSLRQEADKLDEESDSLVDAYQAGSLSTEALVEQYTARRIQFHTVDLKRQAAEMG